MLPSTRTGVRKAYNFCSFKIVYLKR
jgi:hypothetical protein